MANPEHVEIVKRGADAIRQWREKNPGVRLNLGEANLSGADLRGADLSGASLSGASLSGASLSGASLSGADLSGVDLSVVDLSVADLRGAHLREVNLITADLSGANLSGADLSEANLRRANLRRANLNWASLSGADLGEANLNLASLNRARLGGVIVHSTIFANVDLTVAEGLERVDHRGPSNVDVDTLRNSKARIPEAFLRGCGLADWEIIAARMYAEGLTQHQVTMIGYDVINARMARSKNIATVTIAIWAITQIHNNESRFLEVIPDRPTFASACCAQAV